MELDKVQSGLFHGRDKISRYGNAWLRHTLWLGRQAAVLKPADSFRDKFEHYIAQDAMTRICAARLTPPSQPGWREPFTP